MTSRNTVYLNLDGLGLRAFHSCIPYPTHFWPNNNFSYHRSNLDIKVTHCAQNIVGKASHETLGLFGFLAFCHCAFCEEIKIHLKGKLLEI